MPSIFLSHSWSDKPFVRRLSNKLIQESVTVWIDEAQINIGDSLIQKITEGIEQVDYVAAVISAKSVTSDWVQKELHLAMTKEIKGKRVVVLPILIENCEIPSFLKDKLYADFTSPENFESQFLKLLRAIGIDKLPSSSTLVGELEHEEGYYKAIVKIGTADVVVKFSPGRGSFSWAVFDFDGTLIDSHFQNYDIVKFDNSDPHQCLAEIRKELLLNPGRSSEYRLSIKRVWDTFSKEERKELRRKGVTSWTSMVEAIKFIYEQREKKLRNVDFAIQFIDRLRADFNTTVPTEDLREYVLELLQNAA